jgi:hypothetical protein
MSRIILFRAAGVSGRVRRRPRYTDWAPLS